MCISDWSSYLCSSDLAIAGEAVAGTLDAHATDNSQRRSLVAAKQIARVNIFLRAIIGGRGFVERIDRVEDEAIEPAREQIAFALLAHHRLDIGEAVALAAQHVGKRQLAVDAVIFVLRVFKGLFAQPRLAARLDIERAGIEREAARYIDTAADRKSTRLNSSH